MAPAPDTSISLARQDLLDLLKRFAYKRGIFTLASGTQSDFFLDCKQVILTGRGHQLVGEVMHARVEALKTELATPVHAVAGVATSGSGRGGRVRARRACVVGSGACLRAAGVASVVDGPWFDP